MTETSGSSYWKLCNLCKKPIPFKFTYYLCSVSSCRLKNLTLVFCSLLCWDGHLGFARHRSAECEEAQAPAK